MANYALLDENNVVINVITGVDETITQTDLDGTQVGGSTEAWETFYATRPWLNAADCKRTSFNAKVNGYRKNYAAIGGTYDSERDAFIPLKENPSWVLNETTCIWEPPIPAPTDDGTWGWDEETTSWVEIE
jgi:hypothetical protein